MKKLIIILCFIFSIPIFPSENGISIQQKNECLNCHIEYDLIPEDYKEYDIHFKSGIFCESCHGGNPNAADEKLSMSKSNGFTGVPNTKNISALCGKCHSSIDYMKKFRPRIETDQVEQYNTSQHGTALNNGDEKVAVCTSCHNTHSILPANDPRSSIYALNIPNTCNKCHGDANLMAEYDLDVKIYEDFAKGVHGIALLVNKDIGAPSCNDCHGNHGAVPPGVSSISNVCGMCHVNNADYFKHSTMGEAFSEVEFHGCIECHGNHNIIKTNDKMVGVGAESLCIDCHEEGDEGYSQAERMYLKLTSLTRVYDSANVLLNEVRAKGMNDVDIEFLLKDSHQALIQSRTLIHTFDMMEVNSKANEGIQTSRKAISMSNEELNEYQDRRNGFGAATLVITILIIALYLKSRDLNKNN